MLRSLLVQKCFASHCFSTQRHHLKLPTQRGGKLRRYYLKRHPPTSTPEGLCNYRPQSQLRGWRLSWLPPSFGPRQVTRRGVRRWDAQSPRLCRKSWVDNCSRITLEIQWGLDFIKSSIHEFMARNKVSPCPPKQSVQHSRKASTDFTSLLSPALLIRPGLQLQSSWTASEKT